MYQRFLYLSWLAPHLASDTVTQILRQSRERNRSGGITGALVFDGERFCQLLEGPTAVVGQLSARIAADARHHGVRVLFDETDSTPRWLPQWQCGFCEPAELDVLDTAPAPEPASAAALFLALLPRSDLAS